MDNGGEIRARGRDGCTRTACPACQGTGVRLYGSTATWRGGIGGAAMTYDQCDTCWGSGDADRHWPDIRQLVTNRKRWEAEQCARWLARRAGLELKSFRVGLAAVVDVVAKEGRRRSAPQGVDAFWYARAAETIAAAMTDLLSNEAP